MRTQLFTLFVASLVLYSVGRPWMKSLGAGVAIGSFVSLTLKLVTDVLR